METIMALGHPTINEFASFMCISSPNAAYKVASLIKKGYVRKVQSETDRREYHREGTQKYIDYYNIARPTGWRSWTGLLGALARRIAKGSRRC